MTKVQRTFRLDTPLDEPLMEQIATLDSIYGIDRVQILSSGKELMVEFDATRLRVADVESVLERAGISAVAV